MGGVYIYIRCLQVNGSLGSHDGIHGLSNCLLVLFFLGTLTFCYFRMMEHAERQRILLEFIVNPDV